MSFGELKELCNKLVGTWYCEEILQCYIFHFNSNLFHTESKITIINKTKNHKPFDDYYGVGIYILEGLAQSETKFYIDIGRFNKRYYKIEEITKDQLKLREYWMVINTPPSEIILTYKRITDLNVADDILQGLDLNE